jgi:hypothetical protein
MASWLDDMTQMDKAPYVNRQEAIQRQVTTDTTRVCQLLAENVNNTNFSDKMDVRISNMSNKSNTNKGEFRLKIGDFWYYNHTNSFDGQHNFIKTRFVSIFHEILPLM